MEDISVICKFKTQSLFETSRVFKILNINRCKTDDKLTKKIKL